MLSSPIGEHGVLLPADDANLSQYFVCWAGEGARVARVWTNLSRSTLPPTD